MTAKAIVLIALMAVAALVAAQPAVADDGSSGGADGCVEISTDPPGVSVDPRCVTGDGAGANEPGP